MLKDRIGTFVFIEAAMIMRVVGKMKLAILIVSIAIKKKKKQSEQLQKITGKFEKLNGINDADTFLLVYYLSGEKCACVNFIHFLFVHSR